MRAEMALILSHSAGAIEAMTIKIARPAEAVLMEWRTAWHRDDRSLEEIPPHQLFS